MSKRKPRRKTRKRHRQRTLKVSARAAALTAVSAFRREELAALAGGLVLVPENLHHLARLEWLAVLSLCGIPRGDRTILRSSAQELLDGAVGAWTAHGDDPCECLATQTFTFYGGNHLFVAPYPESLFSLRLVANAILKFERLSSAFVRDAISCIQVFCAISDLVASNAGLTRNKSVPPVTAGMVIPEDPRIKELMAAVRITGRAFEELCQRTGLAGRGADGLAVLATPPAGLVPPADPFDAQLIIDNPFLHLEDGIIVLAPHRLAEALVNRILRLSLSSGDAPALAEAFHELQVVETDRNMDHLGLGRLSSVLRPRLESKDTLVSHSFFQCDLDKAIHVAVASPALALSANAAKFEWNSANLNEELRLAREMAPHWFANEAPFISRWLTLVVIGSFGLESAVLIARPKSDEPDVLTFFSSDLQAVVGAELDYRSPLIFWKYSRSARKLESHAMIWATSPLDQFAAWWMRSRSFATTYDVISIECGLGRSLHESAINRLDWHAVPSWEQGRTIEVCNADGSAFPILLPRNMDPDRLRIAVELPKVTLWVVAAENLGNKGEERRTWFELGRMLAYWICESSAFLVEQFLRLGERCDGVLVEFQFLGRQVASPSDLGYLIEGRSTGSLFVQIHPRFLQRYDDTNACEREFVEVLVRAILALPGSGTGETSLPDFIDQIAPLGVKRMVHAISTSEKPEFISAATLPKPRVPDPADRVWIQRNTLEKFPIPGDRSCGDSAREWLNRAVGAQYGELRSLLNQFQAGELRLRLMTNNESLVHEEADTRLTLPSHLACYRSAKTMIKRLVEEGPRRASAMLATRFLLEHVVAEPTRGERHVSDADFDELLALGGEIIKMGLASDVAHFGLAKVTVAREDGELLIDGGTYDEATHGSLLAFTQEIVDREQARISVGTRRTSRRIPRKVPAISELDAASKDEFGMCLSDIAKVVGELLKLAIERSGPVVTVPEEWLRHHLRESLLCEQIVVDNAIDQLALSSRAEFLRPPPGFEPNDIWPWRFNRALSYIRRPLLRIPSTDGPTELAFTPGHLYRSSKNLVELVASGRLKARSKALRNAMGAFTTSAGNEFNDDVALALEGRGFVVRSKVAKIGNDRLVDDKGNTLGDIDVLCVDAKARRIVGVECKDFSMARMPNEICTDMNSLFVSSKKGRCFQEKHLARLDWLKRHMESTIAWVGQDAAVGPWSVEGVFVFSVPLIAPLLVKTRLPVWTLKDIRDGRGP